MFQDSLALAMLGSLEVTRIEEVDIHIQLDKHKHDEPLICLFFQTASLPTTATHFEPMEGLMRKHPLDPTLRAEFCLQRQSVHGQQDK